MMYISDIKHMPDYFDRYINQCEDGVSILDTLHKSIEEIESMPVEKWKALKDQVYEIGKWTTKDVLQHILDTEKVFTYRILSIARGDKQAMLSFDEDSFANHAYTSRRTLEDLIEEMLLSRKMVIKMFEAFTPEMLHELGNAYNGNRYSALALGFTLVGHQRWHFNIVTDRYFPLLG